MKEFKDILLKRLSSFRLLLNTASAGVLAKCQELWSRKWLAFVNLGHPKTTHFTPPWKRDPGRKPRNKSKRKTEREKCDKCHTGLCLSPPSMWRLKKPEIDLFWWLSLHTFTLSEIHLVQLMVPNSLLSVLLSIFKNTTPVPKKNVKEEIFE